MKMKSIVYRGGVLRFRIPATWKEEYSDMDGGTFYEPGLDTGTLRVSVITLKSPTNGPISAVDLLDPLLRKLGGTAGPMRYVSGNAVLRYDESSYEHGTRLRVFYWIVANPVAPDHARVVTFSYTMLDEDAETPEVLREVEMLDVEILNTEFSAQLGS